VELEHRFTVPVGVEEAWAHFQDISSVAECFPGAQVSDHEGDTFRGSVKVKLGPIALIYNGQGTFTEKDETAHRFVVDAKGKDKRGNGTAGATVTLTMNPAGESTDVVVLTDLAITGKPAQFGRGVMQDVSDKLLGQFVACLERRMADGDTGGAAAPAAAAPAAPTPGTDVAAPATPAEPAAPAASAAAAEEAVAAEAPEVAAAPPPPATPAQAPPSAARGSDDALNLGTTVLPILVKSYWKPAVAALVVVGIIIWIVVR
jgi:carbon monoxide dehydrogenase subunit G